MCTHMSSDKCKITLKTCVAKCKTIQKQTLFLQKHSVFCCINRVYPILHTYTKS